MNKIEQSSSITVQTFFESEPGKGSASKWISVSRNVTVNGQVIYKDKMSPQMYMASKDPIKNLESFLLGSKETESCKNISSDSRKGTSLFKKIRRKLFGKDTCKMWKFIAICIFFSIGYALVYRLLSFESAMISGIANIITMIILNKEK